MASPLVDSGSSSYSTSSFRQLISSIITELALAQTQSTTTSLNPLATSNPAVRHILLSLHAIFPAQLLPALDLLDRRLVLRCKLSTTNTDTTQDEEEQQADHRSKRRRLDDPNPDSVPSSNTTMDTIQAQLMHSEDTMVHTSYQTQDQGQSKESSRLASPQLAINDDHLVKEHNLVQQHTLMSNVYYVQSARQQTNSRSKWRDGTTAHYEVRLSPWTCSCPAFAFAAFPASPVIPSKQPRISHLGKDWLPGGTSLGDDLPVCKHILACLLAEKCHQFSQFIEEMDITAEEMIGWSAGYGD